MKRLIPFLIISFSFSYQIKEFVTCKNIENLTPINITTSFSSKDKRVYTFLYFKNITQNKMIDFIWEKYVDNKWKLYADIKLPIYKGYRWRTYSYITIRGDYYKGKWKVSIYDEKNQSITSKEFTIK